MKRLILGASFLFSFAALAHEVTPLKLDPNAAVEGVGKPPLCDRCTSDDASSGKEFLKLNPNEGGSCLSNRGPEEYKEFFVCPSSSENAGEHLYYQLTRPFSPPGERSRQTREIFFHSTEGALNGTFLTFQDVDTKIKADQQWGSDVFLLPRKQRPSVRTVENEIIVTLQTGEEVVFDKSTRAILRGALRDGNPSFGIYTQVGPANVHYSGSGISIRMDFRTYDDPRKQAASATITQGSKTCNVPRARFFSSSGIPITQSDGAFLAAINRACPGKNFSLN